MIGLQLKSLTGELYKVPAHLSCVPARTIKGIEEKLGPWKARMLEEQGRFSFFDEYHRLPLKAFATFSFDELCKLHYCPPATMDKSVRELFESDPRYEIVEKIKSSMWRWSYRGRVWNEVVDFYDRLRKFSLGDNFRVRLDHTTYHNEFGYSKYGRIYLDGVFGYLVYFKEEHILTIGFSVLAGKKILLQQVQSAQRRGNRSLFKLPRNRVEFVIERFMQNFDGYELFIVDGRSLVHKTLKSYNKVLATNEKLISRYADDPSNRQKCIGEREQIENAISHLQFDLERIADFYRNTGRFAIKNEQISANGLIHHKVS